MNKIIKMKRNTFTGILFILISQIILIYLNLYLGIICLVIFGIITSSVYHSHICDLQEEVLRLKKLGEKHGK